MYACTHTCTHACTGTLQIETDHQDVPQRPHAPPRLDESSLCEIAVSDDFDLPSTHRELPSNSGQDCSTSGQHRSTSGQDRSTSGHNRSTSGQDCSTSGHNWSTSGQDRSTSGHNRSRPGQDRSTPGQARSTSRRDQGEWAHVAVSTQVAELARQHAVRWAARNATHATHATHGWRDRVSVSGSLCEIDISDDGLPGVRVRACMHAGVWGRACVSTIVCVRQAVASTTARRRGPSRSTRIALPSLRPTMTRPMHSHSAALRRMRRWHATATRARCGNMYFNMHFGDWGSAGQCWREDRPCMACWHGLCVGRGCVLALLHVGMVG